MGEGAVLAARARAVGCQVPAHARLVAGVDGATVRFSAAPPLAVQADEPEQAGDDQHAGVQGVFQGTPVRAA